MKSDLVREDDMGTYVVRTERWWPTDDEADVMEMESAYTPAGIAALELMS